MLGRQCREAGDWKKTIKLKKEEWKALMNRVEKIPGLVRLAKDGEMDFEKL
jgi:hypothetical protein